MSDNKKHTLFIAFCKSLAGFSKRRTGLSLLLMIFSGLTGGAGLMMLVPLLKLVGFQNMEGNIQGISLFISGMFLRLGIPMNIYTILFAYIFFISLYALVHFAQAVIAADFQQDYSLYWRSRLYTLLTYSQWIFISRSKSSDFMHILTTETSRVGIVILQLLTLLSTGVIIFVHVVLAFFLSPAIASIALLCAVVLFFLVLPKNRKVYQTGTDILTKGRELFSSMSEHFGGIKIAKSYGEETGHIQHFRNIDRERKNFHINYFTLLTML